MQKIDSIEIKNFKSIRHQKIEGCKRINVFIGYPNVGKSNILEALSLISYLNNFSIGISLKKFCRFKELIDLFNDGDKKKTSEILVDDYFFSLKYIDKNQIEFSIKDLQVKKREIKIMSPETAAGLIRGVAIECSVDKAGNIRPTSPPDNTTHYSKPSLKKYSFTHSDFNVQSNANTLDYPFGENLAEVIRYDSQLRKQCGELLYVYNLRLIFDENENIVIQKQLDDFSAFQFSFSQIAETLQRLIFHKAAIASNENTILLFEEPEAHMFPPYISKFTSDIVHDKNNNQFFLTTHSPFVLNDLMDNLKSDELAIYIVSYKKETGETLINRMNEEDMHEAYQFGYDFFMNIDKFISQEQHDEV
jgi:AAA15 family ATPase/GTPase